MKDRIRQLRKDLKMTLEEFGKRLGVTKTAVSRLENGERSVTDQMFLSICKESWNGKYVNPDWLKDGIGPMFIEMDRDDQLMAWAGNLLRDESDTFRRRFVRMLSTLTEDEWEFIERKAKELFEDE